MGRQRRPKTKKLRLPDQPLQRAHQHGGQLEQEKIDRYARNRHQKIIPAAMAQVVGIDRHRLCPAEAHQHHHYESYQVNMGKGIQRHSAQIVSGRIPQLICGIGMSPLMEGQSHQNGRHPVKQLHYIGAEGARYSVCDTVKQLHFSYHNSWFYYTLLLKSMQPQSLQACSHSQSIRPT